MSSPLQRPGVQPLKNPNPNLSLDELQLLRADLVTKLESLMTERREIGVQLDAMSRRRLDRGDVAQVHTYRARHSELGTEIQRMQSQITSVKARIRNASSAPRSQKPDRWEKERLSALFAIANAVDGFLYGEEDDDERAADALEIALKQLDAIDPDWRPKKTPPRRAP
jgi:hypothetical protein